MAEASRIVSFSLGGGNYWPLECLAVAQISLLAMARSLNAQELPPARLKHIKFILGDLLLCAPYGSGQDVEQTNICIMLKIRISRTDSHPAPQELYELIHFPSQATFAISGNLRFGW